VPPPFPFPPPAAATASASASRQRPAAVIKGILRMEPILLFLLWRRLKMESFSESAPVHRDMDTAYAPTFTNH
jgi:hypothetical protein